MLQLKMASTQFIKLMSSLYTKGIYKVWPLLCRKNSHTVFQILKTNSSQLYIFIFLSALASALPWSSLLGHRTILQMDVPVLSMSMTSKVNVMTRTSHLKWTLACGCLISQGRNSHTVSLSLRRQYKFGAYTQAWVRQPLSRPISWLDSISWPLCFDFESLGPRNVSRAKQAWCNWLVPPSFSSGSEPHSFSSEKLAKIFWKARHSQSCWR